ncbi:hypothetical protein IAR50_005368 [Cryptococcus sp. DSM 104548]
MTTPNSKIAVVGAGIYGLTVSLNLKQRGYTHVTVFDENPSKEDEQQEQRYGLRGGAGGGDVDATYRRSRGNNTAQQDITTTSRPLWEQWNIQIASTPAHLLPSGLRPSDRLFSPCGSLSVSRGSTLSEKDRATVVSLKATGARSAIYVIGDPMDMARLRTNAALDPSSHWLQKAQLFDHSHSQTHPDTTDHPRTNGFINTSSGYTNKHKTKVWLRHLCDQAGVTLISGGTRGKVNEVLYWEGRRSRRRSHETEGARKKVRGLKTGDEKVHSVDVVVLACGEWTPNLMPEVDEFVQRTAGSEVIVQLPTDRPDLWDKFSSERCPIWTYNLALPNGVDRGRFYGCPRKEDGTIKFGYRSSKPTKPPPDPITKPFPIPIPIPHPNSKRKHPHSKPSPTSLPITTLLIIRNAISQIFPELIGVDVNVVDTRMGWYVNRVGSGLGGGGGRIADWAPGYEGLFVIFGDRQEIGGRFVPDFGKDLIDSLEKRSNRFPWPSDPISTPDCLPVSYPYPDATPYHHHQHHDSLTSNGSYSYSHPTQTMSGYPDQSTGLLSHHTFTGINGGHHQEVFPSFHPTPRHSAEPPPSFQRRATHNPDEQFEPTPTAHQQSHDDFGNFEALGGLEGLAMVAAGGESVRERSDWVWAKVEAAAGLASAKVNGRIL